MSFSRIYEASALSFFLSNHSNDYRCAHFSTRCKRVPVLVMLQCCKVEGVEAVAMLSSRPTWRGTSAVALARLADMADRAHLLADCTTQKALRVDRPSECSSQTPLRPRTRESYRMRTLFSAPRTPYQPTSFPASILSVRADKRVRLMWRGSRWRVALRFCQVK